jgi:kynurenine formamidase
MGRITLLVLLTGLVACRRDGEPDPLTLGRWIDLSHDFGPETIYWPTAQPFTLDTVSAGETPAGYFYAANNFAAAEHGGTHLDAPIHFARGKFTTDQIPLEQLTGPAVVVDVTAGSQANPDYLVDVAALEDWQREHGAIEPGTIVLLRTGWGTRWPNRLSYLGTDSMGPGAARLLHFPGLDSASARWLVNHRIDAVGIDTPSIDHGQSTTFDSHQILMGANIPVFENVAELESLPVRGSYVVALPMKIRGGSGGPLRIAAFVR